MATKASTGSVLKRRIAITVYTRDGGKCLACERDVIMGGSPRDGRTFNLGHVVADTNGGEYVVANLGTLCRRCNAYMGDRDWQDTNAPGWESVVDVPLMADPGTVETNMERPDWA